VFIKRDGGKGDGNFATAVAKLPWGHKYSHFGPLGQGLFEIRVKARKGIGRAIFCTISGKVVIILNGFIKKTQKTPPSELALAKKRMSGVKKK
jgi:phage-related protein